MKNILTIDVEEIFHTEYAKQGTLKRDFKTPSNLPRVIELLETYGAKATFFILGEIAEIFPGIPEEIRGGGHEVAFHGYDHEPLWRLTEEKFKGEIEGFDQLLRRSLGERCIGFRAPSLSLNNDTRWALKVLADAGYRYDSSIIPAKTPLYGSPKAPSKPYKPSAEDITKEDEGGRLWEFPLLVYRIAGANFPAASGFFLRLLPMSIVERAIKKANKRGFPGVISVHSWELDPRTPKLDLGMYRSFVTYHNIRKTEDRLKYLLSNFNFTDIRSYMEEEMLIGS